MNNLYPIKYLSDTMQQVYNSVVNDRKHIKVDYRPSVWKLELEYGQFECQHEEVEHRHEESQPDEYGKSYETHYWYCADCESINREDGEWEYIG